MKKNKGFTVVELLIVIAIIAILIAILFPYLVKQLENAREHADAATIRSAISEVYVNVIENECNTAKKVTLLQSEEGWDYVDYVSGYETMSSKRTNPTDYTKGFAVIPKSTREADSDHSFYVCMYANGTCRFVIGSPSVALKQKFTIIK